MHENGATAASFDGPNSSYVAREADNRKNGVPGPAAISSPKEEAFAVRIVHIEVRRDRIVASVAVSEERFSHTSSQVIASLLPKYPHLLEHACVNDYGTTFAAVASRTSTPHLLEHMAIENQVRAELANSGDVRPPVPQLADSFARKSGMTRGEGAGATYVGKTRWTNRSLRLARVELSYTNDLVALAALRDAARDLNAALRTVSAN